MYVSQAEYWIIIIIAILLSRKFYKATDGTLRIIMILYFASVAWSFWLEQIYYLSVDLNRTIKIDIVWLHIIWHLPKVAVMVWLFVWLVIQERKAK